MEIFDVELVKDNVGLGITIAGYISDKPNGMLWLSPCPPLCITSTIKILYSAALFNLFVFILLTLLFEYEGISPVKNQSSNASFS